MWFTLSVLQILSQTVELQKRSVQTSQLMEEIEQLRVLSESSRTSLSALEAQVGFFIVHLPEWVTWMQKFHWPFFFFMCKAVVVRE